MTETSPALAEKGTGLLALAGLTTPGTASMDITEKASVQFDRAALSGLTKLQLQVTSAGAELFFSLDSGETDLVIAIGLLASASAKFFFSGHETRRNVQVTLSLGRDARAEVFAFFDNSPAQIIFAAELDHAAEANFTGLTRTRSNTATAVEVNVRHLAAMGRTQQKFFSYASDSSQIRFTGRIAVDPGSSGTAAHQLHRGILLSHGARIDAQPFLNIMHDDVRCTHGSTVGFIDEEALGYLMARGIERPVAERILIHSFERQFFELLPTGRAREFFGFKEEEL